VGLCQCEAERVVILSSKTLDFQYLHPRAELYEEPEEILKALLKINDEAELRKIYCKINKFKKIEHFTTYCPHITIIVDEYGVIKSSTTVDAANKKPRKIGEEIERELIKIVSQDAFAGIQVVITSQRLSSTVISTDLRDLIGGTAISFAAKSFKSCEMVFDTLADKARACDIPVTAKGVGYIYIEGAMNEPRLFKAALVDEKTEGVISQQTQHLRPKEGMRYEYPNTNPKAK
jgi:hypothetical protein